MGYLIIIFIALLVAIYLMLTFFKNKKIEMLWDEIEKSDLDEEQVLILNNEFFPYRYLNTEQKHKLHKKIMFFLREKNFQSLENFEITNRKKLLIAAQACLLVLNRNSRVVYPDLKNIYLIHGSFVEKNNTIDPLTGRPKYFDKLGLATHKGPLLLSWQAIEQGLKNPHDGHNVVYHEFAHNLDGEDGSFDGTPKLKTSGMYNQWAKVMDKEFSTLKHLVSKHKNTDINAYGATNEAEFFAVITEYFFENPAHLKYKHPKLYELLKQSYSLDPFSWRE